MFQHLRGQKQVTALIRSVGPAVVLNGIIEIIARHIGPQIVRVRKQCAIGRTAAAEIEHHDFFVCAERFESEPEVGEVKVKSI